MSRSGQSVSQRPWRGGTSPSVLQRALWWLATMRCVRSWSGDDRRALLHVLPVYLAAELGIRVVRLPRLARWLGMELGLDGRRAAPAGSPSWLTPLEQRRLVVAQRVARHWPLGAGQCLRVSLVSGWALRRHGPRLRLGVQSPRGGRPVGHAWVEVDGLSVTDPGPPGLLPVMQSVPGVLPIARLGQVRGTKGS